MTNCPTKTATLNSTDLLSTVRTSDCPPSTTKTTATVPNFLLRNLRPPKFLNPPEIHPRLHNAPRQPFHQWTQVLRGAHFLH
jgi:hypothetical protein